MKLGLIVENRTPIPIKYALYSCTIYFLLESLHFVSIKINKVCMPKFLFLQVGSHL